MTPLHVRAAELAAARFLVVCCARNERERFPAFLRHYRRLGVEHFLVIDNGSTDDSVATLREEPDCSTWSAPGSYRASRFGMDWCNALLDAHGVGRWCLTVDLDEFLVYPHVEHRPLASLVRHLEKVGQRSLFAVLVDAYGEGPLSATCLDRDTDPFEACPWFDRPNFTQRQSIERDHVWVQGGVRLRRFFADLPANAPALNKVPLVKWRAGDRYVSSTHHLNRAELNFTVRGKPDAVSGALMHFKFCAQLLAKAQAETARAEHYAGADEYAAYRAAGDTVLHDPEVSLRYAGSGQLVDLGVMQRGTWF